MAKQNADIKFSLIDGVSANLNKIGDSVTSFGSKLGKITGIAGAVVGALGAIGGTTFLTGAVRSAADFETGMARVQAVTGATTSELESLKRAAEDASASTGFTATESAAGLESLARAGLSATDAANALVPALNLAKAAGIDTQAATGLLADTLDQFGIASSQAATVADQLAAAALNSGTGVGQIAQAMQTVAPAARAAGLSFEQTAAALGALAKQGIEGGRAGTALRGILQGLSDPASNFSKALSEAGISSRDLGTILTSLQGNSASAEAALASLPAKVRPSFAALLREGGGSLNGLIEKLRESGGAAGQAANAISQTLNGAFKSLSNAFDQARRSLVEPILGPLTVEINKAAAAILEFSKSQAFADLRQTLLEVFQTGAQAVVEFIQNFDFKEAVAEIQNFLLSAKTSFGEVLSTGKELASGIETAMDAIKIAVNAVQVVFNILVSSFAGVASDLVAPFALFSEKAANLEAALQSVSDNAMDDVGRNAAELVTAFNDLSGTTSQVAEQAQATGTALTGTAAKAGDLNQKLQETNAASQSAKAGLEAAASGAVNAGTKLTEAGTIIADTGAKLRALETELGQALATGAPQERIAALKTEIASLQGTLGQTGQAGAKMGADISDGAAQANQNLESLSSNAQQTAASLDQAADSAAAMGENASQGASQAGAAVGGIVGVLAALNQKYAAVSESARQYFVEQERLAVRSSVSLGEVAEGIAQADRATQNAINGQQAAANSLLQTFQGIATGGPEALQATGQAARYSASELENMAQAIEAGRGQFALLNQSDLGNLAAEARRAAEAVKQIEAQAIQAQEQLSQLGRQISDELDRNAGNEEAIAKRRYEDRLKQIELLAKKGGEEAFRQAQETRALAEKAYREELERIRRAKESRIEAEHEVYNTRNNLETSSTAGSDFVPGRDQANSSGSSGGLGGGGSSRNSGGGLGGGKSGGVTVNLNVDGSVIGGTKEQLAEGLARLIEPQLKRIGKLGG